MISSDQSFSGSMRSQTPAQAPTLTRMPAPGSQAKTPQSNGVTGQSSWQTPQYISPESTQSAVNNRMGQAHMMGDPRIFQKQLARNGLGSSKGTDYLSQIGQQQALAAGRADSSGIVAQDQMNNSKAKLDFEFGREREAQALAMVQHSLSQSDWSVDMARQRALAQIQAAQQNAYLSMWQ